MTALWFLKHSSLTVVFEREAFYEHMTAFGPCSYFVLITVRFVLIHVFAPSCHWIVSQLCHDFHLVSVI